jgi:hypothetical protein
MCPLLQVMGKRSDQQIATETERWSGARPCCMDRPVDAVIPCPRGLIRCGRSSGVPAPAYG